MSTYIPENYKSLLTIYDTQKAISLLKRLFEENLGAKLNLYRVSAPLFVDEKSGLNDDLNGYERPVSFDILRTETKAQVVQSLAKWKRLALKRYGFFPGKGLYTDMNAVRRDEDELDNLHSVYVDQWDWEKVILPENRTRDYLKLTVMDIVAGIRSEYNGNLDPLVQSMQDQMLHNYAAELVENAKRLEDSNSLDGSLQGYGDLTADEVALGWSLLEGSGISYAVDKVTFTVENGLEGTKVTRQTELAYGDESLRDQMRSNQDVTGQGIYYYDFFRNASYNYNTDSLQGICASSVYAHDIDNLNGDVDLIYDSQGYQFWYGAYNATDEENDEILYYDENGEPVEMILGDVESLPSGTYTVYRVYMMPDEETYELFARETIGAFSGGRNLYSLKPINLPEVLSRLQQRVDDVQFAVGQSDYLWVPYVLAECFTLIEQGYLPGFAISILLLIGSFLLLMTMSGHRTEDDEIHTLWIDRVPFIIYAAAAILGVALGVCGNIGICYLFYENMIGVSECVILSLLVAVLWELLMFAFCMSVATRLKTGHFMEYTLWHWVTRPVRRLLDLIRENTKLSIRIALVLLVIGLLELLVISASMYSDAIIVWFFLYKILETGAIFYLVLMMNRLREGGRRVANGDYSQPIDTTHMIPVLAEHGADINRVGE